MNIKLTEYPVTHICTLCGTEYIRGGYGYCDESLECAMDSGEHLIAVQRLGLDTTTKIARRNLCVSCEL